MNVDFRVKTVGAETFEVTLHVATLAGLQTLMDFLMQQAICRSPDKPVAGSGSGVKAGG